MGLFSRRKAAAPDPRAQLRAIADFWAWWTGSGADQVAAAIEDGTVERLVDPLSSRVKAIDSRLAWELTAGTGSSRNLLVVTPEGDPAVRAAARRWLLAAPAPDPVWSYADSRQPDPDADSVLELGGARLGTADAVVSARVTGAAVDVAVHHPAFADLPEQLRRQAAFLMLDWVLGENEVETWLGSIETTPLPPLDPVPIAGLRSVVEELRRRHTDPDGSPTWALLQGTAEDGSAVLAMAQVPLRAVTAPQLDTYLGIVVPFTDRTPEGLPGPGSLDRLRALEEHLAERLGGSGRVVAHQTSAGTRVLHLYVDGATAAADQVRAAVSGWDQGPVQVSATPDHGWDRVAHLRG